MTERATPIRYVLVLCAAILALILAVDTIAVLRITNNHDFAIYLLAAERLRDGGDIYAETAAFQAQIEASASTHSEDTPWPYAYPPFLAALLVPLTFLPSPWPGVLWTTFCLTALLAGCWLILKSQTWLSLSGLVITMLMLYQFQPAVVALRLGQIDLAIFLLIVLVLVWLKLGAEARAGLALGVAIGVKLFAGFLVLFLLWKRRWRAAVCALVTGGLCLAASFALVGWDGLTRYLDFSSLYTRGPFAGYPYHQSFNAFFTRAFKPNMFLDPVADMPWLADGLTVILSLALLVCLAWLTRRPVAPDTPRFDMEYSMAVAVMLLVVPPAPRYSFVWLLLGFIVLAAQVARGRGATWLVGLLALGYIFAARLVYVPIPYLRRLLMDGQFMVSALLLTLAIACFLIGSEKRNGVA